MVIESYGHILSLQRLHFRGVILPFPSGGRSNQHMLFDLETEVEVHNVEWLAIIVAGGVCRIRHESGMFVSPASLGESG